MEAGLRTNSVLLSFLMLCFILLFLLLPFNVFSQGRALTLDEAVALAAENNLNLQKYQIDLASSGYSEKKLWSEIFPTINAGMGLGYSSPLFSGNGFDLNDEYTASFNISFALNAGIPYAIRNIKLAHQGNILRYEDAVNQLSIQVTKRFYSLVAEKNNLLLLEEILNLAQRQLTRSEISFRNGLTGELSLLQSRLALENARYNLSAARTAHDINMEEFLAMLGMASNTGVSLSDEVSIVKIETDAEKLISKYLPARPDIVRSSQEIERLQIAHLQNVMQNRAPSVNLSFNWNSSSFDPFADRIRGSANLSIPLDPWIPGSARSQSISRASYSLDKAKLDYTMTEDSAKTQIRSLSALLRRSWDSILIARLSLEAAQRSYQLTEQGFNNGTVEALTLEDVRNNMANAKQRLLQTEFSYFNMILDLSAAINVNWKYLIQTYGVSGEEG